MLNFLIIAYACEPGSGSEPGIGWNWSIQLAKMGNSVTVVTRTNNKNKIENELKKVSYNNLQISFYYCDANKFCSFIKRGQHFIYLYYSSWQKKAFNLCKTLKKEFQFDFCLSLTFGNMWLYSKMDKLNIPLIWGPLGGGEYVPKLLLKRMGLKRKVLEKIRALNKIIPFSNRRFLSLCKHSYLILVRTNDSLNCIPKKYQSKAHLLIETGVSQYDIQEFSNLDCQDDGFLLFSGKFVDYKLPLLAVQSCIMAHRENPHVRLLMLGAGPEWKRVLDFVKKEKASEFIELKGQVSFSDSKYYISKAKAVLITSSREGGSWVIFEAMLAKKKVICFDCSGMHEILDNNCCDYVPVDNFSNSKVAFSKAILETYKFSLINHKKGEEAYKRCIQMFTWENKMEKFLALLQ